MKWGKIIDIVLIAAIGYLVIQKFVVNKPSKEIDLQQLELVDLNNQPVDMKEFAGKGIFLNFWASWCGPCMAEMPSIASSVEHFSDNNNIVFILANTQGMEDAKKIKAKEKYANLPIYVLKNSGNIDIKAIPLTYLIDAKGKVQKAHAGVNLWNNPLAQKKIKNLAN